MEPFKRSLSKPQVMLAIALAVWSIWLVGLGYRQAMTAVASHWPITLTMVFGSIIAGGTSLGGGAVAFPVFTKLLQIPPHDAKVFSLAIQAVGMGAASLTIWLTGIRVEGRFILCSALNYWMCRTKIYHVGNPLPPHPASLCS